jgi:hypothetical protein
LLIGAAMLMANSVHRDKKFLAGRELYKLLACTLIWTIALATLGGLAGRLGAFNRLGEFAYLRQHDMWRPIRFMSVWGIHLGAYTGGAMGTVWAVWRIWKERVALTLGDAAKPPEQV